MLDGSTPYYTLLTALPQMPADFEQMHLPVSGPRLEDRLDTLDEATRNYLNGIFLLLSFDGNERGATEKMMHQRYTETSETSHDGWLRQFLAAVIDVRDIVAALRCRKAGLDPPMLLGKYGPHIKRNWHLADFRLGLRFPWIIEVKRNLENNEILAAERRLSAATWLRLRRISQQHHFTLRALLGYLLQWLLVRNWAERNLELGKKRFTTLLDEAMNGNGRLFD